MFKLKIETGNSAFEDDPYVEVVRILELVITKLSLLKNEAKLYDINGNPVGSYKLTKR